MGPTTLSSAVKSLIELGFLYEWKEIGWPTKMHYGLTYKGEEVARNLIPIEALLEETVGSFRRELSRLLRRKRTEKNLKEILDLSVRLQGITRGCGEWEESIQHSERVLELSEKLKSEKTKAGAYRNIGFINQKREGYEEAATNFEKSLEIALKLEDFQGASEDEYALGVTFEKLGDCDKAMDHYKGSVKLARKTKDETGEARARLGIGRIHHRRRRHRQSIDVIKEAAEKLEELSELEELPRAYANLGCSSLSLGEGEELRWHEKCIEASRKTGDIRMLGYGYSNAAACYMNERKWRKSKEYLEKAMSIFQELGEKEMISSVYLHLGNFHRLRREWARAKENFSRSLDIAKKSNFPYHLGDTHFHLGLMCKEKDERDRAQSNLESALETFKELGDEDRIRRIRKELGSLTQ